MQHRHCVYYQKHSTTTDYWNGDTDAKYLNLFLTRRSDDTGVTLVRIPEAVRKADSVEQEWDEYLRRTHICDVTLTKT